MKVYSPSSTSLWLRCPMLWSLDREGWRLKQLEKRDLAAAVGTAFAAGVGAWNNMRMATEQGGGATVDAVVALGAKDRGVAAMGIAGEVYSELVRALEASGVAMDTENMVYSPEQGQDIVQKAVAQYCANDPIPNTWRIVSVEEEFPQHGNCRTDLVVRMADGRLAVVDNKTKVQVVASVAWRMKQEYENSQQAYHYPWAVEETYHEPCDTFIPLLCIFKPRFTTELLSQRLSPESRQAWLGGMRRVWENMALQEQGMVPAWMSDKHSDQFGQCPMKDACFTYHWDENLMLASGKYIKRV